MNESLDARKTALENWLRTEGIARVNAYDDGRIRGRRAAEVFARIRARHAEQAKSRT